MPEVLYILKECLFFHVDHIQSQTSHGIFACEKKMQYAVSGHEILSDLFVHRSYSNALIFGQLDSRCSNSLTIMSHRCNPSEV